MTSPAAADLDRFVKAQEGIYAMALAELKAGQKRTHWMWFIFPQMQGLGQSAMARTYGIGSRAEALAYLGHPLLGERLAACTIAMLAVEGRSARAILGSPDDLKFCSSMTLFAACSAPGSLYHQALERYCGGSPDPKTLALLESLGG